MIKIGDIVRHVPNIEGRQYMSPMPCRVVWIHPDEVYYTVEFTFDRGRRFREAFFMPRSRVKE
jgi:hypothetical protein